MTQANTLPDPQTAYNTLFDGVHQRIFFSKCASAGYVPRTADEAGWMLETAGKLRMVDESQPSKQASDENNPYYQANLRLDHVLSKLGLDSGIQQARFNEADMAIKHAAADLTMDPTFYNSVLSLKAAEAIQLQEQYQQWQAQQAQQKAR